MCARACLRVSGRERLSSPGCLCSCLWRWKGSVYSPRRRSSPRAHPQEHRGPPDGGEANSFSPRSSHTGSPWDVLAAHRAQAGKGAVCPGVPHCRCPIGGRRGAPLSEQASLVPGAFSLFTLHPISTATQAQPSLGQQCSKKEPWLQGAGGEKTSPVPASWLQQEDFGHILSGVPKQARGRWSPPGWDGAEVFRRGRGPASARFPTPASTRGTLKG